jgi:hypothetical protein
VAKSAHQRAELGACSASYDNLLSIFEALNPNFEYRNKSKTRNSKAQNDFGHWHFEFWICLRFRAWDLKFPFRTNGINYLFAAESAKRRRRLGIEHRQKIVDLLANASS